MRLQLAVVVVVAAACSKSPSDTPKRDEHPTKHEDRADKQTAPSKLVLRVMTAGATTTWTEQAFTATPKMAGQARDGESRDTWSLRELVHRNAAPTARVVAVVGERRVEIDAAAWDDPTRTPIVHVTRRGTLKFRWAAQDGTWGETIVNDVTAIELAP